MPERLPARRMRPLLAAPALLGAALLAQAGGVGVEQNGSLDALYAEHDAVPSRLVVAGTSLGQALVDAPALGTPALPIEMTEAMTPAQTALRADDWTYAVKVEERGPASVGAGNFTVSLTVDGQPWGEVVIGQSVSDPLVQEGASVTFDVGPAEPVNPLIVVRVAPVAAPGQSYALQPKLGDDLSYRWLGVGGDIDGQLDPNLTAPAGAQLRITISCGDCADKHDLRVKDGDGKVVAGPTDDIYVTGSQSATLTWTPDTPGTYRYECKYHAASQRGTLTITGGTP